MDPLTMALAVQAGGQILGSVLGKQKAPKQAEYKPVDPAAVQKQTIAGNMENMAGAQELASRANSFNQGEANRLMEQAMPGFSAMQKRLMAQVNQDLDSQNTLPQDVKDQISRFAAEKGVSRGTSGNFNGFSLVKDFGFNLTDWRNAQRARALNTMSSVFGMTPRINPMSPMSMMVDPNTAIGVQGQNNAMAYNTAQAGYNAQAAASNYNRMMIASAVMNATNFAGNAMMSQGQPQSQVLRTPDAQGNTMTPYYVPGRR
jgi:hypothetical protein